MSRYAEAVEQMIRTAENNSTDALCQLSAAQRAFEEETEALRKRLAVAAAAPAVVAPPLPAARPMREEMIEASISDRLLQILWTTLVAAAVLAFSVGFWLGRNI
jgi:hypothetical protein